MQVALLVPWRPGCPYREATWERLKRAHLDAGRTVIEGGCEGEWRKAVAVANALSQTTADRLVIHDADVWTDGLDAAIHSGARWAVPHLKLFRLAQGQLEPATDTLDEPPYTGRVGGGVVVIDRDLYEQCPLDPRFAGWGGEDDSWGRALKTLHGPPWRGSADLWHWWHPPQPRARRDYGSEPSRRLAAVYDRLQGRKQQMAMIVEEARTWQTSDSTEGASASS